MKKRGINVIMLYLVVEILFVQNVAVSLTSGFKK